MKKTARERAALAPIKNIKWDGDAVREIAKGGPFVLIAAVVANAAHYSRLQRSSTPIRKVGEKRKIQQGSYARRKKVYMANHPTCEAMISPDCAYHSFDLHHKFGRVGINLANPAGFMAVCRPCHDHIHRNPSEAREKGLLK